MQGSVWKNALPSGPLNEAHANVEYSLEMD